MLVHLIADYGPNDLAFAEAAQALRLHLPEAEFILTPVGPFDTLAAGFCIAQLGLNRAPEGTLIFHNVAPREDDPAVRSGNAGERLAFAKLPGGVAVVGVTAGLVYSFVRDHAEDLRWVDCAAEGSQFRSRDVFPEAAARVIRGEAGALGDPIPRDQIPDIPEASLAYVDGYGNLKTTIPAATAAEHEGKTIRVKIGKSEHKAVASAGSFAVEPGQLAFAPGSSGWPVPGGEAVRWVELFLRGGNAWEHFDRPPIGSEITIR